MWRVAPLLLVLLAATAEGQAVACKDSKRSCPRKVLTKGHKCATRTETGHLGKFPTRCPHSCGVCALAGKSCIDKKDAMCRGHSAASLAQNCAKDRFIRKCRLTCGICTPTPDAERPHWMIYPLCSCNRWNGEDLDRTPTAQSSLRRPYFCQKTEDAGRGYPKR